MCFLQAALCYQGIGLDVSERSTRGAQRSVLQFAACEQAGLVTESTRLDLPDLDGQCLHVSSASRVIQITSGRGSCVAEQGDNGQFGTCWEAHSCNGKVERCSSHPADQVPPLCSPALRGRALWVAEVCHWHFFCCALLARQAVDGGSGEARRVSCLFQHGSAIKEAVSLRCRRAGLEEETGALCI